MDLSTILAFDIGILAASISPGPAFVLTAQTALRAGKAAGLLVALGVVLAASIWLNASFFGLSALMKLYPQAHIFLKIVGGLYLIYLGVKMWRHAHEPLEMNAQYIAKNPYFMRGFLINITNPKAPIFCSAIVLAAVPNGASLTAWAFLISNHFVIEFGWLALCVTALSTKTAREAYLKNKIYFDRACAIMLIILGLSIAY